MKINESCIDHNAVRIISDLVEWVSDGSTENVDNSKAAFETLGEIRGVMMLAEVLKEVLKC